MLAVAVTACHSLPPTAREQLTAAPPPPAAYRSFCLDASLGRWANEVRGYGQGASRREAQLGAYQDLAEKLKVRIDASTLTEAGRDRAGQVRSSLQNSVQTRTLATLEGVEQVCLDDQGDARGQVHLALRLDMRAPGAVAAERWQQSFPDAGWQWQGSPALLQGAFFSEFRRQLERQLPAPGTRPATAVTLFRQLDGWQLQAEGRALHDHPLPLAELVDWAALDRGALRLQPVDLQGGRRDAHLRAGEDFRFRADIPGAGYLTLINLYGDGELAVLRQNLPVTATLVFPDKGALSLAPLPGQARGQEYFVAVWSPQPASPAALAQTTASRSRFQALLDWLADENLQISVQQLSVSR